MKHVMIVIPTRNRWYKLTRMLSSVPTYDWLSVAVVCDGDAETHRKLLEVEKQGANLTTILLPQQQGSVAARNAFLRTHGAPGFDDGVLYATDDIEFEKGAIEQALKMFNLVFPDDDGVVGFAQDRSHHPSGVGLVGKKFLARYPDKQLFNPEYFHFGAQEIYWLANDVLKKFVYEPRARLEHYHPAFFPLAMDKTHREARKYKSEDMALLKRREAAGLVWGSAA